ncbi:3-oxoacyl-ACP synthase III family protein [Streptomyces sp. NPDC059680]|uniref:3-oxoacyl-ACP synthase III family protein n=1 Tax=Streptomyces sp. NPDC059680 TaxID=3346904 RepID=UPI00368D83F2
MSIYSPSPEGIGILGTGSYLPKTVVPNSMIAKLTDTSEEWILDKTGIRERHYAAANEAASDMAVLAAQQALINAGLTASDIDWIIVATSTPDQPQPATAALTQDGLGAYGSFAFDVNCVCAGFVVALHTAARLVARPGSVGRALVIGSDVYSRILDFQDRRTAPLFGDGAGAVVIGSVDKKSGFLGTRLVTDGMFHDYIGVQAGGSRRPACKDTLDQGEHYFRMRGREVRNYVIRELPVAVNELLDCAEIDPNQVNHFIPHQANGAMLSEVWERLGLKQAKAQLTVERHGNTGTASIPLALDAANRSGALIADELILMAGFGGGMTTATILLRWGK